MPSPPLPLRATSDCGGGGGGGGDGLGSNKNRVDASGSSRAGASPRRSGHVSSSSRRARARQLGVVRGGGPEGLYQRGERSRQWQELSGAGWGTQPAPVGGSPAAARYQESWERVVSSVPAVFDEEMAAQRAQETRGQMRNEQIMNDEARTRPRTREGVDAEDGRAQGTILEQLC